MGDFRAYQIKAYDWIIATFGYGVATSKKERVYRFLEEALELAQSLDCSKEDAEKLVEYVFNRPKGTPFQEIGGTIVCLASLCNAMSICLETAAMTELNRCWEIKDKIRAKWELKQIRCKEDPLP